uniref:Bromo domain-containing protein n=1 Tax=Kalanchoe fedtschenkoi TaxID=63787 RepID=A0A7N0UYK0_KALFE
MASGALGVGKSRGERKLKKRNRVKKNCVPQPCSQAVRSSSEEDDFSHLFRANEEWHDASGDNGGQDDSLVEGYDEIGRNELHSGFTRPDSYLVINLSALMSKGEIEKWKRKLEDELEQVRDMAKQLEDQQTRSTSYSSMGVNDQMMGDEVADRVDNTMQNYLEAAPVRQQDELFVSVSGRDGHKSAKKSKKVPETNMEINALISEKRIPISSSRSVRKPTAGESPSVKDNYVVQALKSCKSLLTQLMKHKFAWVFNVPVDAERFNLYDYHTIIKHPMDLGTVKERLTMNWYESPMEFAEDVRLTFHNAMIYNPKDHDVHLMAEQLLEIFEKKWLVIEEKYNRDLIERVGSEVDLAAPISERIPHPSTPSMRTSGTLESGYSEKPANSASSGQEMVPEMPDVQRIATSMSTLDGSESSPGETPINSSSPGQEVIPEMPEVHRTSTSSRIMNAPESYLNEMPVNRSPVKEVVLEMPEAHKDMSYEEKQKLNSCIQELPPIKLGGVVDIIKKRNATVILEQPRENVKIHIKQVLIWILHQLKDVRQKFLDHLKNNSVPTSND